MKIAIGSNLPKQAGFVAHAFAVAGALLSSVSVAQAPPPPPPPAVDSTPAHIAPAAAAIPGAESAVLPRAQIIQYFADARGIQCDYKSHRQVGDRLWVACGEHGLLELRYGAEGPQFLGQRQLGGTVDGFFHAGGSLWALVLERRAVSVTSSSVAVSPPAPSAPALPAPSSPLPPTASPVEEARAPEIVAVNAKVSAVSERDVMIDAGSAQGLLLRDRIALHSAGSQLAGGQSDAEAARAVVGRVVELWAHKARVHIGLNERVPLGSEARLTRELPTASRVAPPRIADIWELRVMGRPFFSLGELGGGLLAEASLARRVDRWRYGVHLGPIGVAGKAEKENIVPWAGFVFGEFDTELFAAGLGVGAQAVNSTEVESGSGLSVVQTIRLGSVDGLHLSGRTTFVIFRSETSFSSLEMQGQFSVGEQSWLIARGGGGVPGFGFGEVALRTLLRGNGGAGSFFLEVAVGGEAFYTSSCQANANNVFNFSPCEEQIVGGPMLGVGGEWRY